MAPGQVAHRQVDECVRDVRCEGDCEHVSCQVENEDTESRTEVETVGEDRELQDGSRDPREEEEEDGEEEEEADNGDWQLAGRQGTRFKCPLCRYTRNTKSQIIKHIKTHEVSDGPFICEICNYQSNNRDQVNEHISTVHENSENMTHDCRSCDSNFNSKTELNTHIIDQHKSHKPCRNFATNSCEYDICRFNHVILKEKERICFKCGDRMSNQALLIMHMKQAHISEPCKNFLANKCSFGTKCMFSHSASIVRNVASAVTVPRASQNTPQRDFWPLLTTAQTNRPQEAMNMNIVMNQMMNQLNLVMAKLGLTPQ